MPRPRKVPALAIGEIIERYRAGEPLYVIGLHAKVSACHVRRLLVGAGVELRTTAEINRSKGERRLPAWQRRLDALAKLGPPKD